MRFVRPKSIGRLHCCGTRQEFRLILPLAAFVLLPLASGAAVGMAQAAPGGTVDFSAVLPPQKPALEVGAPSVLPAPKHLDASQPGEYLIERQRWVIGQMNNLGLGWLPFPN